ncbi:MAG: hypothetical protein KGH75_00400 [Rhodospirillales bacterium]|nr:hypothetical protein [Rhodospirillales bacterium]
MHTVRVTFTDGRSQDYRADDWELNDGAVLLTTGRADPVALLAAGAWRSLEHVSIEHGEPDDLLGSAWGLIANAHGGDWTKASDEWREAAEEWREDFHAWLGVHPDTAAPESPL